MKIIIVKTSALGDIIHAFDALAYLRHRYPFARIDWVVEKAGVELLSAHPAIDNVYGIDTHQWRRHPFKSYAERKTLFKSMPHYSCAWDLQGNCKSAWVLSHIRAQHKIGFGRKSVSEWPNLLFTDMKVDPPKGQNIRKDYLCLVQALFTENIPFTPPIVTLRLSEIEQQQVALIKPNSVIVCPFAAWPNKCLPSSLLIKILLQDRGPFYFAWGNESEKIKAEKICQEVSSQQEALLLPKLSLPGLQQAMAKARRVYAMDSLPLHLCATTQTESISFFGPSAAAKYAPQGKHHHAIQGDCPFNERFEKRCRYLRTCQSSDCINKLKFK